MVTQISCDSSVSSKKKNRRKRKTTSKRFVVNKERELGQCRGKKQVVCLSDPNCSYRRKVGCVKKRNAKEEELFYGPTLSNISIIEKVKSRRKSARRKSARRKSARRKSARKKSARRKSTRRRSRS